jgi:hypothetical protein
MVLNSVHPMLNAVVGSAPLKMPFIALVTFTGTYLVIKLISLLPKSKWVVG